jgi:hypothetical protein
MLAAETGEFLFTGAGEFMVEIVDLAVARHVEAAKNVE